MIGLLVDNLSAVNNLLTFLYESTSERYTGDKFVTVGLAACTVEDKVRLDIVVQVAFLQLLPVSVQLLVLEELFVGSLGGIDFLDRHAAGLFVVDNADHAKGIFLELFVLLRLHDALLVKAMQTVGDDFDIVLRQLGDALRIV